MRTNGYVSEANLDEKATGWLTELRSRVAPRSQFRVEPGRAALLVIDMNRYFADPSGRCFLPAAAAIIGQISKLVTRWRTSRMPVVYTRHGHEGEADLGMLGKFFSDYIKKGTPESEIIPALAPTSDDTVIEKTTYDAFLNTPLEAMLRDRGVDQVVVTGVLTHMCCETTARSAFCRGFEVFVPVDGVASSDETRHLGSLLSMADAVAIPTRVDEVIECLHGNR